jgi:hypothetical protein
MAFPLRYYEGEDHGAKRGCDTVLTARLAWRFGPYDVVVYACLYAGCLTPALQAAEVLAFEHTFQLLAAVAGTTVKSYGFLCGGSRTDAQGRRQAR